MKKFPSLRFGNTKKEADYLANLILAGKKKATSSLYESYKAKNKFLPKKGNKVIVKDSKGKEKCIIQITKVSTRPFNKITKAFAKKEGEGNLSLSYWKKTHKKFFAKRLKRLNKKFDEKILVVCEEFVSLPIYPSNQRTNDRHTS